MKHETQSTKTQEYGGTVADLINLIVKFESKNNISTTLIVHSDGSGSLNEFWEDDVLLYFKNFDELMKFLKSTSYELDDNGVCFSPIRIKGDKNNNKRRNKNGK